MPPPPSPIATSFALNFTRAVRFHSTFPLAPLYSLSTLPPPPTHLTTALCSGPLSLGDLYRFCRLLNAKLADPSLAGKALYVYTSTRNQGKRANAAVLMCCFAVIYMGCTPMEAFAPFYAVRNTFKPFHDASQYRCTYSLTVFDCVTAVYKAKEYDLLNFDTFDLAECLHYEQVEHGDLNWIAPNMCAFAGPQETREMGLIDGYSTLVPEDYVPYFLKKDVRTVLRLNKQYYTAARFEKHGIRVIDLYYADGGVPTMELLQAFLVECEQATTCIGVHCKAGLGRTGTCMGAYLQKHYRFTASEAIAWIRICRPGSIIGPQQQFLAIIQAQMWEEGDVFRRRNKERAAGGGASPTAAEQQRGGASDDVEAASAGLDGLTLEGGLAANSPPALSSLSARRGLDLDEPDRSNQAAGLLSKRRSPSSTPTSGRFASGSGDGGSASADAAGVKTRSNPLAAAGKSGVEALGRTPLVAAGAPAPAVQRSEKGCVREGSMEDALKSLTRCMGR